ncbi:MAG: dihydroorotase [Pseudomonadota bacterium]
MTLPRISIAGGRILDPANGTDEIADLHIADGQILAMGDAPDGFTADQTIDADATLVCPGLIDLCARLGEPGFEQRGTIASETRAAAHAGVTSVCCPPDTLPVIDEPSVVELILNRAQSAGCARVLPLGALTLGLRGEHLTEASALMHEGCVALSHADAPIRDVRVLRRAMEYAGTFDIPMLIQPQDAWLATGGCAHEGAVATRLGLPGIPVAAETVAIAMLIELAAHTGARLHLSRLTSARGVETVRRARAEGLAITADVGINHLYLTDIDVNGFNSLCHTLPPLRTQRDREALIEGIKDGTIDAICSDHNPCESDAKLAPFEATHAGISSLDTLLPLLLRLQDEGIDLNRCVELASAAPARILSIDSGTLAPGANADIVVIDPEKEWEVSGASMKSAGTNTPYAGWMMRGAASTSVIAGRLI